MTRELSIEESALIDQLALAYHKQRCEESHLYFSRYFFKLRHGLSFRVNWHHELISNAIEDVIAGRVTNLIINVSPGSSKTELVVINFIARGLALNHSARFLHLSYSQDLASMNSAAAKDLVMSEEFQRFWPMQIMQDSRGKKRWNVEVNGKSAGGVYATALGGQITGFRAGHMASGFQGAIIIDDPLKVEDSYSKTARNNANRKLVSTVKSRKATPDTPTVIIMQRLSDEDPTGFIEAGNVPGDWKYLRIPALLDDDYVKKNFPSGINIEQRTPRDAAGRFSYWPYKEPLEDMLSLEEKNKYVFNGQYQQRPSALGGSLIKGEWFRRYSVVPQLDYRIITVDTAQKTAERNDYSVFEHWGAAKDTGHAVLLDVLRGKWEAPELKRRAREFWLKCQAHNANYNMGRLRKMLIEDKSSGTGLLQEIAKPTPDDMDKGAPTIPVEPIERTRDKLTEWMDAIPHMESGYVLVPENADWLSDFIGECESLTAEMTHAHDDQVDPMCDAIDHIVGSRNALSDWQRLANTL